MRPAFFTPKQTPESLSDECIKCINLHQPLLLFPQIKKKKKEMET